MSVELTKSGKPVSQKTFGTLVHRDKECRKAAVDLDFDEYNLRLVGRYIHHNGYRSLIEARSILQECVAHGKNPFATLQPKQGVVVDMNEWAKNNR